ncbi:MAG: protein-L-isoaspartate O-methyltransferase [Patescibacteria group bacterium]|nr:protein-L-isoaspartate O-methyltransferase [Patescibacteria group bacterium]
MPNLIDQLVEQGYLRTPEIIKAFYKIKREDFLLPEFRGEAEANYPLPIGYGQTISQPLTVAFMLELLQPKKGDKVLDVGSGSGWTTALLAEIVGEKGRVFALEIIPELKEYGEKRTKKYNFVSSGRVVFICGDGSKGLVKEAPFDKIHVAAAATRVPQDLLDQLKIGGRLVIPVGVESQEVVLIEKIGEKKYQEKKYPGFLFVPLITQ